MANVKISELPAATVVNAADVIPIDQGNVTRKVRLDQLPSGTGSIAWDNVTDKPASFTPSAHASSHHTSGTDQLAAHQINGQTIFDAVSSFLSTDTTISANRARQLTISNTNASGINVTLPTAADGTLNGDTYVIIGGSTISGPITIRRINMLSPLIYETLATITTTGQQYRFRASGGTTGGWSLVPVDTHTHVAADITDFTAAVEAVSPPADWDTLANKPAAFTPSSHSSSHHTGGADAIAPNQISAAWEQVLSNQTITSDTLLSAGRNRRITLFALGTTANVDLPYENNQAGDVVTLVSNWSMPSTLIIRKAAIMGNDSPLTYSSLATLNASGQSFTFVSNGTATGWSLKSVDTHTHAATQITGLGPAATEDFAAPPAIGSSTPNSGAFTTLTANNGTLTASAPVLDLSQTWNDSGTAFTAIKLDITNTASDLAGSKILDVSVGGTNNVLNIYRSTNSAFQAPTFEFGNTGVTSRMRVRTSAGVGVNFDQNVGVGGSLQFGVGAGTGGGDVILSRDAADTLALVRGTNAQTFNIYNTSSSGNANYERGFLRWSSNTLQIGTEKAGTGSDRDVEVYRGTERRIAITSTGTQFRRTGTWPNGFIEVRDITSTAAPFTQASAGVGLLLTGFGGATSGALYTANNGILTLESVGGARLFLSSSVSMTKASFTDAGVPWGPTLALFLGGGKETGFYRDTFADAATERFFAVVNRTQVFTFGLDRLTVRDAALLCFGGTTSSFPALKRNSTTLEARLADDSAYTAIQGKLTTETAYTAGAPTATGYLVLYDSNGTAYKVPAEAL